MAVNTIEPKLNLTTVTSRGPSPVLWADCPVNELLEDPGKGIYYFEDFTNVGLITAPTTEAALVGVNMNGFSSDAGAHTILNTTSATQQVYTNTLNDAGVMRIFQTTNDHSGSIRSQSCPFRLSAGFGKLWFEARIRMALTATTENSFFVGLMEDVAATVSIPLTTTGTLADKNLVGFHKPEANTTTFNCAYKADGVTSVVVNTGVGALVNDTYVKLGMLFDPNDGNKLSFYIDNVKQASTKVVPNNTGTDFPADMALGWCIGMGVGAAASDNYMYIDWIRAAQLFVG